VDIPNLGTNLAMAREHLQIFAILLFAVPVISFVSIKLWIAARASKTQRTTNWFVPDDLESETARLHYSMGRSSVAFAHARKPVARRDTKVRRSA
jgi:hypothetical protein